MPRLKSINCYQNKPKFKLIFAKKIFFRVLGALPQAIGDRALPTDPQWPPTKIPDFRTQPLRPMQISGYSLILDTANTFKF